MTIQFQTYVADPPMIKAIQYTGNDLVHLRALNIPLIAWDEKTRDLTLMSINGPIVIHRGDFIIQEENGVSVMGAMEFGQKYRTKIAHRNRTEIADRNRQAFIDAFDRERTKE